MCIFSANVAAVADTNIFTRLSTAERQFLAYSMSYSSQLELAMILPLPIPRPESGEDAVRFINLSRYADFFTDMAEGFPPIGFSYSLDLEAEPAPRLRVHSVGSFDASFVPSLADFDRLDSRFRLPTETWRQLPIYSDYGFAVYKLKPGVKQVHPMALEFPTQNPEQLFFPTVHVHEGKVDHDAEFDHSLYCQVENNRSLNWRVSSSDKLGQKPMPACDFMNIKRTEGLVNPELPVFRKRIRGTHKNKDILIQAK